MPDTKLRGPTLKVYHDGEVEIYLNGILAAKATRRGAKRTEFGTNFTEIDLAPEAEGSLRPGVNLLAVHCRHHEGSQYIDVGLLQEK